MVTTYQATSPLFAGVWETTATSDWPVSIDLVKRLATSEAVTNPASTLWLLRQNSTINLDKESLYAGGLDGAPTVNGTVVSQGLHALTEGRVYLLQVLFGPANNRRPVLVIVRCVA